MQRAEEYRRNAEDAEREASRAATPHEREAYERIARGWRDLEAHERRREVRGV